jgi:hypothetical protein
MRNPHTRKCKAPKVLGEPERCGKPFPARSVKKTCSPGCARKLRLEWKRRDNQKKAEKRPLLTCATPGCEEQFTAYKSSKFCPKHRGDYYQPHQMAQRRADATARYWKDPVAGRAKGRAKRKAALAKDPAKFRAKKNAAYHADFAKDPEKYRAKGRKHYHKDIKKSRAWGRSNYAKHADKINARQKAAYWADPELSRAEQRAKQASRKERHPRRYRALQKAKDQRRRDKASW